MHHKSVLLYESIESLNIHPRGIYVDGTFGLGGHSKLILSKLSNYGRLIALDKDWSSVSVGKLFAQKDNRFSIKHASFSKMFGVIDSMQLVGLIDGILLDLGLCESQILDPNRGFSFMKDGPLDMRMDINSGQSAAEWIATASQHDIEWVLKNFGEERFAKNIARSIVLKRKLNSIASTHELSSIISNAIPSDNRYNQNKHPATRSFLAIRIYINQELEEIAQVLKDVFNLLSPKGRLVVISFNSLEDRLIKKFILQHSRISLELPKLALTESQILSRYCNKQIFRDIGKLKPSVQEIKYNIRARSATLRCIEKLVVSKNAYD